MIVEVDGDVHQQQVEADQEREQILVGLGYRVIRFTNAQVFDQTDLMLEQIRVAFSRKEPSNSDANASKVTPSPKSGFGDFGEGAGG